MNEVLVASRVGTAGPYLLVPVGFAVELMTFLVSKQYSCCSPEEAAKINDTVLDSVLDTSHTPAEIAPVINEWFKSKGTEAKSFYRGEEADPVSIYWEFTV